MCVCVCVCVYVYYVWRLYLCVQCVCVCDAYVLDLSLILRILYSIIVPYSAKRWQGKTLANLAIVHRFVKVFPIQTLLIH